LIIRRNTQVPVAVMVQVKRSWPVGLILPGTPKPSQRKREVCFFVDQQPLLGSYQFTMKRLSLMDGSARAEGFFRQESKKEGTIENKTSLPRSIR
jgi:hypothetical protein